MDELSSTLSSHGLADESDVAFAAEAAAQSLEEADAATAQCQRHHQQQQLASANALDPSELVCRICGRGNEEGRPIIRFFPLQSDPAVASIAPTVLEDIALHVFCGKTATILPNVNQPDLEILSKAGLKNKHGIGAEVNSALARTRCATLHQDGAKEKQFFLVREFEAHLTFVRSVGTMDPYPHLHSQHLVEPHQQAFTQDLHFRIDVPRNAPPPPPTSTSSSTIMEHKASPIRAAAGQVHKHGRRYDDATSYATPLTSDGKVKCGCGGYHFPPGTPRGAASYRSHIATQKHQNWLQENGMLGSTNRNQD